VTLADDEERAEAHNLKRKRPTILPTILDLQFNRDPKMTTNDHQNRKIKIVGQNRMETNFGQQSQEKRAYDFVYDFGFTISVRRPKSYEKRKKRLLEA
jgi:hypothetical protein